MAARAGKQAARYAAFISYRHVDADRRWARWLHRWLESYRIPRVLRKQRGLPGRVGRVFRDEEELAASSDLSVEIQSALEGSDHLVVVCSPHTPASRWVEQEIARFRDLGRDDKILALLVEGEPGEAFPRPLREIRRQVSRPGGASREEIEEIEPLAADVRPSSLDGAGHVRRMAGLRLLACILGVSFDELRRREHERRMRRRTVTAVVLLLLTALISTLAVIAVREGRRADDRAALASARLATMYEEQGRREWLDGRPLRAAPYLAAAYAGGRDGVPLRLTLGEVLETMDARTAVLLGHTHDVFDGAFAPGGARIVTASVDRTARIWDATSGAELVRLKGHRGLVRGASFDPDGSRVVTASMDGTVGLWDSTTGAQLASLEGDEGHIPSVDISPDGAVLVTTRLGRVRIWDAVSGRLSREFDGRGNSLRSVRISPDGTRVVASADGGGHVWDLASGEEICSFGGSLHAFHDALFSPDGATILTFEGGGNPRLWSLPGGEEIAVFSGHDPMPTFGAFSPDGKLVVAAGGGRVAGIWPVSGEGQVRLTHVRLEHADEVTSARFSPDGRHVLTASRDGTATVWEVSSGLLAQRLCGHTGPVWGASWSPDGMRILTWSADASGRLWDAARAREVRGTTPGPEEVLVCAAHADGSSLGLSDVMLGTMSLWDLNGPRRTHVLPFRGGSTAGGMTVFDPAGQTLAAIVLHTSVALVDAATGEVIRTLCAPTRFHAVGFDATGRRVATGHEDGTCRLWALDEPEPITVLQCHTAGVACVAFSADGSRLATGSLDHTARVWDLGTGRVQCSLEGHRDWVRSVCFHPTQDWLVTGSKDQSVKIWDLAEGRMRTSSEGHAGVVLAVDVSPDGALVVSGGHDASIRVWDAATGGQVGTLIAPTGEMQDVWFGSGGESLCAVGGNHVFVWPVHVERRGAAVVGALVRELSPYELVEGRLVSRPAASRPDLPRVSSQDR